MIAYIKRYCGDLFISLRMSFPNELQTAQMLTASSEVVSVAENRHQFFWILLLRTLDVGYSSYDS
jgi:hypothetical protein